MISPEISENVAVTTAEVDPVTGWQVAIKGVGKTTFIDGVEYGADTPALQALVAQTATALVGLGGLGGLGTVGDVSLIRAASDATTEGLTLDVKLPGNLNLEARLWAEGKAKVTKKNPGTAAGFKVDRVVVGLHGEAMGLGVEILVAFDPIIGKGKPLSIQKLTNAISTKNSKNLGYILRASSMYTDNKTILELGLGMDTSSFTDARTDVLNSPSAQAAFAPGWDTAPGTLFA